MVKKIFSIFEWIVISIVAIIAVFILGCNLFGFKTYSVISQSMGNEIPVGSFAVTREVNEEEAKSVIMNTPLDEKLRIVCQSESMNIPVLHQVIAYDETTVTIHGIANKEGVNEVFAYSDVKGIVVFSIPVLGFITQSISNIYFWIIIVLIIVGYIVLKNIVIELTNKNKQ